MNKGLDREQVRSAFEELAQENMPGEEAEDPDITAIKALALKRGFEPGTADRDSCEKFIRFLLRKGFGYSSIRQALGNLPIQFN